MRIAAIMLAALLTACASFTQPMYPSAQAEQAACLESAWCRALIDDRPAWVFRYHSAELDCMAFAADIANQAQDDGRKASFVFGVVHGQRHVVAVIDGWAVDNGGLGAPLSRFPAAELAHWMRVTEGY